MQTIADALRQEGMVKGIAEGKAEGKAESVTTVAELFSH